MAELPHNPELERPILTYEEFSRRKTGEFYDNGLGPPINNNFFLHFIDTPKNHYRNNAGLAGLRKENPDFEQKLTEAITKAHLEDRDRTKYIIEFQPDLYQAYLIMRKYVQDDYELFG